MKDCFVTTETNGDEEMGCSLIRHGPTKAVVKKSPLRKGSGWWVLPGRVGVGPAGHVAQERRDPGRGNRGGGRLGESVGR